MYSLKMTSDYIDCDMLLTIFILPNTSRRLLSLPSDHPLGSLTLSANMGARNCSSVVLEKNYYCNLMVKGNIALCLPVVGHQPHVVAEQRGDAQAEQQRHEEHEQKVVPATIIFLII